MWLFRVFESAFVRKVAYMLAAAAMGFLISKHAHAQALCWQWTDGHGGTFTTPEAAVASINSIAQTYVNVSIAAGSQGTGRTVTNAWTCSVTGSAPAAATCTMPYTDQFHYTNGDTDPPQSLVGTIGVGQENLACPVGCSGKPNMDILEAIAGNTGRIAGSLCVAGCSYTNSAAAMNVGGSKSTVYGQAIATGASCATATAMQADCGSSGGITLCYDSGTNKVSMAGDVVSPSDLPQVGNCVIFASGGSMCTYTPAKPLTALGGAPTSDGTTVDVPVAVVTTGASSDGTGGTKSAYFSAAQNAASPSPTGGTAASATETCTTSGSPPTTSCQSTPACTASLPGVTPVVTCKTAVGGGSVSSTAAPCPPGQTCTGVTDANSGGQDCTAPPVCTDADPNVCGVINQQWLMRCQSVTESGLAAAVLSYGGALPTPVSTTVDVSAVLSESSAGQFGAVVGGSDSTCPAPLSFVFMGRTITLDLFLGLCLFAQKISIVIMVAAYMIAAKIMFSQGGGIT
jgi:hypothetical protein